MHYHKLADGVYSVGVMNPALRVFDIIMEAEYGTSYNAYLIKGEKATALVETVHTRFFDEYIESIEQLCDPASIDYVILNHTEPDHSGSLKALMEKNPNIEVIASMAGSKYLTAIANVPFKSRVVKAGDTLDLGGKTLKFIPAPFLHWPDSMFTYIEEDKLLFSCDMFGCHYCEPRLFDVHVSYPDAYQSSLRYYYDCIFGPFKPYVLSGLDKIKDLKIDIICPSHGPVLTKTISDVWAKYESWSTSEDKTGKPKKLLILYVSAYGCTARLADIAAEVAKEKGYEVETYDVIHHDTAMMAEKLNTYDVFMLGSPTINKDALKPIWDMVSTIDAINSKGRPCAVFGSYGWSGEAVGMLCERLNSLKCNVFGQGYRVNLVPSETELEGMRQFATEFLEQI